MAISFAKAVEKSLIIDNHDVIVSGSIIPRPTEDLLTAACGACTVGDIVEPIGNIEQNSDPDR